MEIEGKKILVTGGAGFIASHIVESLVSENADVTVFDDFSTGRIENLDGVKREVKIIRGDILDYNSLLDAMKDVDVVSHHAAHLEIFGCIEDPVEDLRTNTIGTLNVLKASVEKDVKKVVNVSSACVYGEAIEIPQSELHPKNPNWPYGVSKLAAEKYCEIYRNLYGLSVVSLRYGIVYGEREWFGRVLSVFINRVLNNKPPVIFGDGKQVRDFIYVGDVAEVHNKVIISECEGGAYNIGTGIEITISDLARLVIEISGKKLEPVYEDVKEGDFSKLVEKRRRIPLELKKMVLDVRKAREDLGWLPRINLEEGIRREMDWASNNPDKWNIQDVIRV